MRKIQKISEIEPTLGFTEFDFYQNFRLSFSDSELGKLRSLLPVKELPQVIGLNSSRLGRESYFSPAGKVALMFLKSYMALSDAQLIDNLNFNPHLQLFCDIRIHPLSPLTNSKIVSSIRCEIARRLDIDSFQEVLATHWNPCLENQSVLLTDATCYESFMPLSSYCGKGLNGFIVNSGLWSSNSGEECPAVSMTGSANVTLPIPKNANASKAKHVC
jgi:hypothetical protein